VTACVDARPVASCTAVFTGIVEEMGRVLEVDRQEGKTRLAVGCETVLGGLGVGDSVAVNGVCLTVVEVGEGSFAVDAVPETLRRSNLGDLAEGRPVNLERALGPGRTMGGHYVQGHVDATGVIARVEPEGDARTYVFEVPAELMRYVVPKGFVAVDGVSLTVVDAGKGSFSVTVVPHTRSTVVMGSEGRGYRVNVEVDVMAKYVDSLVGPRLDALERRIERLEGGEG